MIQLSEIESYRKGLDDKVDEFGKQIREFASRYFPDGAIDFYSNFVISIAGFSGYRCPLVCCECFFSYVCCRCKYAYVTHHKH